MRFSKPGLGSLQVTDFLTAATTPVTPPTPPPTNLPTTIGLGANPTTINTSQTVVFSSGVATSTPGTLTGTVQFFSNGLPLGAPVALQQGYATSPPESFPTVGTYAITATYSGNSTYASSTTATSLKLLVTPAPAATTATTLALASPSITVGGSDALTVTVNSSTATGPVPTGYVQLSAGGTTFGAPLPLSQGTVTTSSAVTSLPVGTTQITAAYLGDSNYLRSTSAPQTLTRQRRPTDARGCPYATVHHHRRRSLRYPHCQRQRQRHEYPNGNRAVL